MRLIVPVLAVEGEKCVRVLLSGQELERSGRLIGTCAGLVVEGGAAGQVTSMVTRNRCGAATTTTGRQADRTHQCAADRRFAAV